MRKLGVQRLVAFCLNDAYEVKVRGRSTSGLCRNSGRYHLHSLINRRLAGVASKRLRSSNAPLAPPKCTECTSAVTVTQDPVALGFQTMKLKATGSPAIGLFHQR
jgi:hypothetical protein